MIVVPMQWRDIRPGMLVCACDGTPTEIGANVKFPRDDANRNIWTIHGWNRVKSDDYVPTYVPTFSEAITILAKHFTFTFLEWEGKPV
jgi:hypothetical protein